MKVTMILSIILMAALTLMLYAAVALIQSKKLFGSAPKDIQAAITEHMGVWDYSNMSGNIMGQVCPQFLVVWIILAAVGIVMLD